MDQTRSRVKHERVYGIYCTWNAFAPMSIQLVNLHTAAAPKWTAAQENALSRDYPFRDHDPTDPVLFVQRTYLHFLWLPHVGLAFNHSLSFLRKFL
jgi:hypothetical protein